MHDIKHIVFKIKGSDHRDIKERAAREGISMQDWILRALALYIYTQDKRKRDE